MTYRVRSHLGEHYVGDDLLLANIYADSVVEVECCFGYITWPYYESQWGCDYKVREQVCSEDCYKFVSITLGDDE